LIFSESCWHYGLEWKDAAQDRMVIFNYYSNYLTQWHKVNRSSEVIKIMLLKRRTAFRGVWGHNFHEGQPNDYYASDNQVLYTAFLAKCEDGACQGAIVEKKRNFN